MGTKKPGSARNALVAAVIAELPPPGEQFPAAERQAWLRMMATAFDVAYGLVDVPMDLPTVCEARAAVAPVAPSSPPAGSGLGFHIDKQGFARDETGARINPDDVMDIVTDLRGVNGDLGTIVWADGSTGIPKGKQLDITAG